MKICYPTLTLPFNICTQQKRIGLLFFLNRSGIWILQRGDDKHGATYVIIPFFDMFSNVANNTYNNTASPEVHRIQISHERKKFERKGKKA